MLDEVFRTESSGQLDLHGGQGPAPAIPERGDTETECSLQRPDLESVPRLYYVAEVVEMSAHAVQYTFTLYMLLSPSWQFCVRSRWPAGMHYWEVQYRCVSLDAT